LKPANESSRVATGQAVVFLIADAAFVHRDGTIVWNNAAAERAFGASGGCRLVGASAWTLIADGTDVDSAAAYRKLGAPDGPHTLRLRRRGFDGSAIACELRGATIDWDAAPATLVVVRDEAPAAAASAGNFDAGDREFDFAEISPDAMIVHQFGGIVFVNPAACEMFRAPSPQALVGRDIRDLVHPDEHAHIESNWDNVDAGARDPLIGIRRQRLDGTVFIGEGRHKLVRWNGRSAVLVVIRDATPRIEARQVVEQREAEYRRLLDHLPDAVLAHVDGTIVYANRVAAAQFRAASADILIGMTMRDITHPDDRAALTDAWLSSSRAPDRTEVITRRRLRLDGTAFVSEARRIGNDWQGTRGIVLVMQDVTDRLAAERELRESEARHRAITEVCPDAMLVHIDGSIVYANPAAARLFGADATHLTERTLGQLILPEDWRGGSGFAQPLEFGQQLPLQEVRVRDRAGRTLECETVTCGYRWNGAAANLMIVRDIGARKQAERRLIQAREDAVRANETKSRFLASMSHELRTPLNSILGFSEVIKSEMFGPVAKHEYVTYAGHIHQSGQHLLSLIDDLLDISKAEAGKYEIAETTFDLTALIENALLLLEPLAQSRQISLALSRCHECPISAGEREIHQVITNLVSNAIKFTPDGGAIDVTLTAMPDADIAIAIADTGIGISEADKARLFEAYSQVGNPLVKSGLKGTGLGLALSRHLIVLHGGDIAIDSIEGEGTTVTVSLPASRRRDRNMLAADEQATVRSEAARDVA
jgi:PAS domain S-box-containing protein